MKLILFCRKLVLLKLEKGYEFGDVLLDGTLPGSQGNTLDSRGKILSTSMFTPVKDNTKRREIENWYLRIYKANKAR